MFSTQPSMFDLDDDPTVTPLAGRPERIELTCGAWVDRVPGWLTGSDELLARLLADVPWRAERREMFEREVDVPRLLADYGRGAALPHPVLEQARDALNQHYAAELGERFVTAGLCLYRDGRDSVAWHGDRLGRGRSADTMIAILGVGEDRVLALREREPGPDGRRRSERFPAGHGDLLVMGGSCQRTWDHAVPKTAKAVGPRISIQFRPAGVA